MHPFDLFMLALLIGFLIGFAVGFAVVCANL